MPTTSPRRMTAEEFLALGDAPEGCTKYELVDGEVVVNEPSVDHQRIIRRLIVALGVWASEAPDRGEPMLSIDTLMDERNVYGPDVQWFSSERELPPRAPWPAGDIVAEVRSPSTWARDTVVKRRHYERQGVRELWLVDGIARSVLVLSRATPDAPEFAVAHELTDAQTLTSPLLPGFALDLGELF